MDTHQSKPAWINADIPCVFSFFIFVLYCRLSFSFFETGFTVPCQISFISSDWCTARQSCSRWRRSSVVPPSNTFSQNTPSELTPNFEESYMLSTSPDIISCFQIVFMILFSLTWDYMGEKLTTTAPLKVHNKFTPKNSCIHLGRV